MLSNPSSLEVICYELDRWFSLRGNQPTTVWDIGPGWGKWSLMIREILASRMAEAGDMTPSLPLTLTAFEMCAYFLRNLQRGRLYDRVIPVDFRLNPWRGVAKSPTNPAFPGLQEAPDILLMFDVLEHWEPAEIDGVFQNVFADFPRASILVSIPRLVHIYVDPYYGEDCPKHKNQMRFTDYQARYRSLYGVSLVPSDQAIPAGNDVFWVRKL